MDLIVGTAILLTAGHPLYLCAHFIDLNWSNIKLINLNWSDTGITKYLSESLWWSP